MSISNAMLYYYVYEVIHMKPLKKKVSITLDEDVIEKTKLLAEETDRSFSQYINILLKKHIEAKENKLKTADSE